MLRTSLLSILYILIAPVLLGQADTINQTDSEGRKQGWWVYYGKDRPEAGFPPEGKIAEGTFVDDRKSGYWYKYYRDGKTLKLKGFYENNRPRGNFWKYYDNETIKEQGTWINRHYVGLNIRYYPNSKIKTWSYYSEEGKEIGESYRNFANGCREYSIFFDSTGVALYSVNYYSDSCDVVKDTIPQSRITECFGPTKPVTTYDPGKGINISTRFNDSTSTFRNRKEYEVQYSDSVICNTINEMGRCYNKDQELFFYGICKEGKVLQGKLYYYDRDGILLKVEIWKNGEYQRDGVL